LGSSAFDHKTTQRCRHEVIEAEDGKSTLALISQHKPDILLLDMLMPEMDGLEVLDALGKDRSIPVIMLSADIQQTTKDQAMEKGVNAFLHKPPKPDEILKTIDKVLGAGE
jgi:two-component system chemotaxis response regulator CheY